MSTLLFANNTDTTLAGAITNTAVTLNVQSGAGALFPNPGASQYFVASLVDAATQTVREIIWVTARSGDTFTVVRGQEGTSAQNWLAGDFIANDLTAGQMNAFQQGGSSSSITATSLIYYGVDTGTADSMVINTSPTITGYTDGMVFETTPAATNLTATPQANICALGTRQFANAQAGYIVAGQKLLFSYDGNLNKFVLTTLPNTATQTMRGIVRQATVTEATNFITTGSVPAFVTPEGLGAAIPSPSAVPVATTTVRGISREATTTEDTNGVTTGSVPAFVTPEGMALYVGAHTTAPLKVPVGATGYGSFNSPPGAGPWSGGIGSTYTVTSASIAVNIAGCSTSGPGFSVGVPTGTVAGDLVGSVWVYSADTAPGILEAGTTYYKVFVTRVS